MFSHYIKHAFLHIEKTYNYYQTGREKATLFSPKTADDPSLIRRTTLRRGRAGVADGETAVRRRGGFGPALLRPRPVISRRYARPAFLPMSSPARRPFDPAEVRISLKSP
jgi:hypothetical protein